MKNRDHLKLANEIKSGSMQLNTKLTFLFHRAKNISLFPLLFIKFFSYKELGEGDVLWSLGNLKQKGSLSLNGVKTVKI